MCSTRSSSKRAEREFQESLRSHYASSGVGFVYQEGFNDLSKDSTQQGLGIVPTLLKENIIDPSAWKDVKKPTYFNGLWPPESVQDFIGSPSKEEECASCRQNGICMCDYKRWSASMHFSWIDNIRICRTPGKGYGMFTQADLQNDQVLGEYTGELIPIDKTKSNELTQYVASINIGKARMTQKGTLALKQAQCWVDSRNKGSVFRFLNHSCESNAALMLGRVGMNRRILMVVTTRKVLKGEEITVDYGVGYFQPGETCLCGTHTCRFSKKH